MEPKRQRASGASSSFNNRTFVSADAEARFEENVSTKGLIAERGFELDPECVHDFPRMELVERLQWRTFIATPDPAVCSIVREFYSNFAERKDGRVFVRGKWVPISRAVINNLYNLPNVPREECTYRQLKFNPEPDYAGVSQTLCETAENAWLMNSKGTIHRAIPVSRLPKSNKHWAYFVCARFMPCSHTSDLPRERAFLVHCIIEGGPIDVGSIIMEQILQAAESQSQTLFFPAMITELCKRAGVTWGSHEELLFIKSPCNSLAIGKSMRPHPQQRNPAPAPPVNAPAPPMSAPPVASSSSSPAEFNQTDLHAKLDQMLQLQETQAQRFEAHHHMVDARLQHLEAQQQSMAADLGFLRARSSYSDECIRVVDSNLRQFMAYTEGKTSLPTYEDLPPPPEQ